MKKSILILASALLIAPQMIWAQGGQSSTDYLYTPTNHGELSRGFTLSLLKDFTKRKYKNSLGGSGSDDSDQALGLGIGYNNIKVQDIGFSSLFAINYYDIPTNSSSKFLRFRAEANATFGINQFLFAYMGANVSMMTITGDDNGISYTPGLGFQAGLGAQINQQFGIKLGYGQSDNKIKQGGNSAKISEQGIEVALTATF